MNLFSVIKICGAPLNRGVPVFSRPCLVSWQMEHPQPKGTIMDSLLETIGRITTYQQEDQTRYKVWLAPEGMETSDHRFINEGALSWRDGNLPLMWTDTEDGHEAAFHVGNLNNLQKEEQDGVTWVIADAEFDTDEQALEAKRLVDEDKLTGVSIHMADFEGDLDCKDEEEFDCTFRVTLGVIAAATIVAIPAFADARIVPVVAAVSGDADLPLADRDREWDSVAAQAAMFGDDEENPDFDTARRGHFYVTGEGTLKGDFVLPFADVIDGTLTAVPAGVFAAAGGRGVDAVDGISADEKDRIKGRICGYYERINEAAPDDAEPLECPFAVTASAATDLFNPPREWFTDPGLEEPTFLTVTDDGRIYGHLTPGQDRCHLGFPDSCVTPPYGNVDYEEFNSHARVLCADGANIPVGVLTFDGPHAPTDRYLSVQSRMSHYDNTTLVGGYVRAGEDSHGTWIAGALAPGLSEAEVEKIRRLSLSGDWLPRDNQYVLVAALAVPVPGFSIRAKVASAGTVMWTVGPAAPQPEVPELVLVAGALQGLADMIKEIRADLQPVVDDYTAREQAARLDAALAAFR